MHASTRMQAHTRIHTDTSTWALSPASHPQNLSLPATPSTRHPLAGSPTLDRLRRIEGNHFCADCGAPEPDWASLNLAVLVCIECSGVHRQLGGSLWLAPTLIPHPHALSLSHSHIHTHTHSFLLIPTPSHSPFQSASPISQACTSPRSGAARWTSKCGSLRCSR